MDSEHVKSQIESGSAREIMVLAMDLRPGERQGRAAKGKEFHLE